MKSLQELEPAARGRIREIVANFDFSQGGLAEIGRLLPTSDEELHEWLQEAIASAEENEFCFMLYAAGMAGRKLQASLLPKGVMLMSDDTRCAWIAWRMEGDVCRALQEAVENGGIGLSRIVTALLVAALWWKKHHPGEEFPRKLVRDAADLTREYDMSSQAELYSGLLLLLEQAGAIDGQGTGQEKANVKRLGRKTLALHDKFLHQTFEHHVPEKRIHRFVSNLPMCRAVPKISRNDPCRCGSGKKYKDCCERTDRERLRHSSYVPGKTDKEVRSDLTANLTMARLKQMRPAELLKLDAVRVAPDLQHEYLMRLGAFKRFEALADAFQKIGVAEPRLRETWSYSVVLAVREWKRDLLQSLIEARPGCDPELHLPASARLLLASNDPAAFLLALEAEVLRALQSGAPEQLSDLSRDLFFSPYRALTIVIARGEIPLAEPAKATEIFDEILTARAHLDLPPDDEFGDFMEERAARERAIEGSTGLLEKEKQLAAAAAQVRQVKEELGKKTRELALREKRAKREAALDVPVLAADTEKMRELNEQVKRLQALQREHSEERVARRRELQRLEKENGQLRTAIEESRIGTQDDNDDDEGEDIVVEGNQPLRLIRFPTDFRQTLAKFPKHVGRAAMSRLGQMAAGEPSAFTKIKRLRGYPEVLRARVSDRYRLLYVPLPDEIRVVDLIFRPHLDKRVERLKASGLPPVG